MVFIVSHSVSTVYSISRIKRKGVVGLSKTKVFKTIALLLSALLAAAQTFNDDEDQ